MKTGINDSGVNLTQKGFLNILIPVPSLEEQQQIIQEIESRLSVCDKMEETITNSLQQVETLRQSILKRAFEGKLI
jgi:type I restriction enzyme S subunit